jgi:glutathione S-transferase
MLELYNNTNSVCAQKIRLALAEKKLEAKEHSVNLRGGQFDPAYLKLNPNGVVPTLVHDGRPVIESSVILYYLEDAFPEPPLMPAAPLDRARVHMFNKLIDEYIHNSCMILTFSTAFRPAFLKMTPQERDAEFFKTPVPKRAEYKRDVINNGLDSIYVREALAHHQKLFAWMDEALARGPYLAGNAYSLAECAVIPYLLRLELLRLNALWDRRAGIADWWRRMRARDSTQTSIFARMTEADWAPFKNLQPDPWPKVQQVLDAA